jgi:U3 small nucleolar RNA-associated protein 7
VVANGICFTCTATAQLFLPLLPPLPFLLCRAFTDAMDSLFEKANAISPLKNNAKGTKSANKRAHAAKPTPEDDRTTISLAQHTSLPRSLRPKDELPADVPTHSHVPNKKLRTQLNRQSAHSTRARAMVQDAALLLNDDAGMVQVEDEIERTWRVSQTDIAQGAGEEAAKGRREWKLDGGPYRCRYTRNGR